LSRHIKKFRNGKNGYVIVKLNVSGTRPDASCTVCDQRALRPGTPTGW